MKSRLSNILAITFLALTVACTSAGGTSPGSSNLPIKATALPLNPSDPLQDTVGRLRYRGGFELRSRNNLFGGLSGLDVTADGQRLIAMSDNGRWISVKPLYDKGNLSGVTDGVLKPIKKMKGYNRPGNWRDAESLAQDGSGGYYVAFEHQHRIWHYPSHPNDPIDAEPEPLKGPDDIEQQPINGGIETLTRLCDRRLLAISEEAAGSAPGTKKAWVFDGKSWKALNYATTGNFRATGAATLPDCNLAILERSFSLTEGLRARVLYLPARIDPGRRDVARRRARGAGATAVRRQHGRHRRPPRRQWRDAALSRVGRQFFGLPAHAAHDVRAAAAAGEEVGGRTERVHASTSSA